MSKSKPNQQFSDAVQGSVQVCGSVCQVPAQEFEVLQQSAGSDLRVRTSYKEPVAGSIYLADGNNYVDLTPQKQFN